LILLPVLNLKTVVRLALFSINFIQKNIEKPSKRELEIIKLISKGYNNVEIGEKLVISKFTVKTHRGNLLKKYSVKNTAELVAMSKSEEWI